MAEMEIKGRKEIGEAVIIAALCAIASELIQAGSRFVQEKQRERNAKADKAKKPRKKAHGGSFRAE